MATVVITFFLITQFYVFKMDDDPTGRPRSISQRDNRWSMNSQRLEAIVAELMKPISDVRRSFDTDLSALLEEYLTEAGLRALAAEEAGAAAAMPNFAELALLLQQSASIYSRKVDCLYQHVLSVSDSLQHSTQEIELARDAAGAEAGPGEEAGPAATPGARRKRKASAAPDGFAALVLLGGSAARRDASLRPPPTLPRMFAELAPRALADADAPLCDYAGEPVGLLADYHVAWRLQDGFLVEELRSALSGASLRPVPLAELSAAIAAAARSPSPLALPPAASPLPLALPPAASPPALPPPPAASTPLPDEHKRERKRRSDAGADDEPDGPITLKISNALRQRLRREREFGVPDTWLRRVLRARRLAVLGLRRALAPAEPEPEPGESPRRYISLSNALLMGQSGEIINPEWPVTFLLVLAFRGFDMSFSVDVGGFRGWSAPERAARRPDDSDDDGFFEQSSLGDSDASRADDCAAGAPEWQSWRARVVRRAAAGEARARDVRGAAAALLRACAALPPAPPFGALLARAAKRPADVSELLLATLFLANAGNVEIIQGAPLSLDSFSVRLLSDDQRLYCAALAPPPDPHAGRRARAADTAARPARLAGRRARAADTAARPARLAGRRARAADTAARPARLAGRRARAADTAARPARLAGRRARAADTAARPARLAGRRARAADTAARPARLAGRRARAADTAARPARLAGRRARAADTAARPARLAGRRARAADTAARPARLAGRRARAADTAARPARLAGRRARAADTADCADSPVAPRHGNRCPLLAAAELWLWRPGASSGRDRTATCQDKSNARKEFHRQSLDTSRGNTYQHPYVHASDEQKATSACDVFT
ncbi:uncharacterized protein LOC120630113 [Pararge aegeria]|uniref:uncharacterized protein LOC120630113 n=1 Tax=Pararge aegeria TaxID=116150 RepID=UPI0019D0CFB1|nr:uncharacterized protein LOC120630113 [Pararge aegeria]